jgi:hypothetical protein
MQAWQQSELQGVPGGIVWPLEKHCILKEVGVVVFVVVWTLQLSDKAGLEDVSPQLAESEQVLVLRLLTHVPQDVHCQAGTQVVLVVLVVSVVLVVVQLQSSRVLQFCGNAV